MNNCAEVRDNLSAWIDGELPETELLAVEQHLVSCDACRAEADDLRRVQRVVAKMPLPELPRDMVVDINRAIDADELVARRPAKPAWRRPAVLGSLAAAAMVVMMLTYALPSFLLQKLSPALEQEQVTATTAGVPGNTGVPAVNNHGRAAAAPGRLAVELPVREPEPVRQEAVTEAVHGPAPAPAPAPVPAQPAAVRSVAVAPPPAAVADQSKASSNLAGISRAADEEVRDVAPVVAPVAPAPRPSVAMAEGTVMMTSSAPGATVVTALRANQAHGVNIGGNSVTAIMPVMSLKRFRSHVAPRAVSTSMVAGDSDSVRVTVPLAP